MNRTEIDWKSGRVTWWSLDEVDATTAPTDQLDFLDEDLAQVVFPNGRIVDAGWYPAYSADGSFVIVVVRRAAPKEWDQPMWEKQCRDFASLRAAFAEAVEAAENRGADDTRSRR